jgi:hypothetical protein
VIRIAIEILEVDTSIENASPLIELTLHSDLATDQIKNNAGVIAYKSTGAVELGDNKFFIHSCFRGKIEIAGESCVWKEYRPPLGFMRRFRLPPNEIFLR